MKMTALLLLILLASCSAHSISESTFQERIRTTPLGIEVKRFHEVFPEAQVRGAKAYPKGNVEVYEIITDKFSFFPTGSPNWNGWTGMENNPLWFYFFDGRLIQYGTPNDWPKEPDKILEVRHR